MVTKKLISRNETYWNKIWYIKNFAFKRKLGLNQILGLEKKL